MSMSHYIQGIVPPDDTWEAMKAVWDACAAANIQQPREVVEYFNGEVPDDAGVVLSQHDLGEAVKVRNMGSIIGFDIELSKLPPHVKTLRAVISY